MAALRRLGICEQFAKRMQRRSPEFPDAQASNMPVCPAASCRSCELPSDVTALSQAEENHVSSPIMIC